MKLEKIDAKNKISYKIKKYSKKNTNLYLTLYI